MTNVPYIRWFPDSNIARTWKLNLEEIGALRLIIDLLWIEQGWLDDNDKLIASYLRTNIKKWNKIKPKLISYFSYKDGKFTIDWVLEAYQKTAQEIETNRDNGRRGGEAKAAKNKEMLLATATITPEQNSTILNPDLHLPPYSSLKAPLTSILKKSGCGKSAKESAQKMIEAFDKTLITVWGKGLSRKGVYENDIYYAEELMNQGLTTDSFREFLFEHFGNQKRSGNPPPESLASLNPEIIKGYLQRCC